MTSDYRVTCKVIHNAATTSSVVNQIIIATHSDATKQNCSIQQTHIQAHGKRSFT